MTIIDRGAYDHRRPGSRPFFHPGVMMPRIARALVNLARVQSGERLYDPFCGTGGILVEGALLSADAIGTDADPVMAAGTRCNVPQAEIAVADAAHVPFADCSIDAVVTDLPYGQSSCIQAPTLESLYEDALGEIGRILRPGRRAVVVTHRDIRSVERCPLELIEFYEQRVHKSLTRRMMVLQK
jgi:tRNA (guanine10-N2)-dimethyltransferase